MVSLLDALVREAADDPLSAQEIVDHVLAQNPDDVEALVIASRVRNRLALRDDAQRAARLPVGEAHIQAVIFHAPMQ